MANLLKDFPNGPLDIYRNRASFDWKKLKVFLCSEEFIKYEQQWYDNLKKYSIFIRQDRSLTYSFEDGRKISAERMLRLLELQSQLFKNTFKNMQYQLAKLVVLCRLDPSAMLKHSIALRMFPWSIEAVGTEIHKEYMEKAMTGEIIGAFCLTEIGHGSNAKAIETTATYDEKTKEFVLNSPNFMAAKCWAANLGEMATHVVVYAQLITPDGVNHSTHPFIVKVRDPDTLLPYPGVIVGDMGEKLGLNAIDNGYMMFNQYRIPKENLLNKVADVTEDGRYVTPFRDPNKRYGASIGALSVGRILILTLTTTYACTALTAAIRYAAVRKQFSPEDGEEVSILEYQSHQRRLIPYLSATFVLRFFGYYIARVQGQFISNKSNAAQHGQLAELGFELHAVSSAIKPLAGWTTRDVIQECRESCAGHGYLKAAGLGDLRNDNDANCTYEGENHVLIQQSSNWLLKLWPHILEGKQINFPLQSVNFLTNAMDILKSKLNCNSAEDFAHPENLINIYQWLVCYLLKTSFEKHERLLKNLDPFWAKSESQVYYLKNLAIAYIQNFMIEVTYKKILESPDKQIRSVLTKILSLYGVWSLEKHIPTIYEGEYASGPNLVTFIQTTVLNLCKELKNEAVSLIDVIAPPDFLNCSILGQSDGMVYKHLEDAMLSSTTARPSWWKEVGQWKSNL